jgi:hypothetical protein
MSTYDSTTCSQASHSTLEFVRYFPRQLLTADDMRAADEYFREKMRRHNRMLHGWGVVCGCKVEPGGMRSASQKISLLILHKVRTKPSIPVRDQVHVRLQPALWQRQGNQYT